MTINEVTDSADPRIADFTALTDVCLRRKKEPAEGLFMAESLEVIQRAVAAGYRIRSVLTLPKWLGSAADLIAQTGVDVYVADAAVLQDITGYRLHRGLLAAMDRRPLPQSRDLVESAQRLVILHGLVDHTNVGAAFRSAAAMGMDGVLVTDDCADPLYRRSIRVSMGTVFQVPWTTVPVGELRGALARHETVALTPADGSVDLTTLVPKLKDQVALIVGSEGPGLNATVLSWADHRARIPMTGGVDSLNVAAAVAVACFALGPAWG